MKVSRRPLLPLFPLLQAYLRPGLLDVGGLGRIAGLGPRFEAILKASDSLLNDAVLDHAPDEIFRERLLAFYDVTQPLPLHRATVDRRRGLIRHALGHIMRGRGTPAEKLARCLESRGSYRIAGLGPRFWSATLQTLDPYHLPAWTPEIWKATQRLGLIPGVPTSGVASAYRALQEAYQRVQSLEPALTALHVDHFLTLVALMTNRDLQSGAFRLAIENRFTATAQSHEQDRQGKKRASACRLFRRAITEQNGLELRDALALIDSAGVRMARISWKKHAEQLALWGARLWDADDAMACLREFWAQDPVPGAKLWYPVAVLHLRAPKQFPLWNDKLRQGYLLLDDVCTVDSYSLFREGCIALSERLKLNSMQIAPLLEHLAGQEHDELDQAPITATFCEDTFQFLRELSGNNRKNWMEKQRNRYRFVVREPLVELCRKLTTQYVRPVLQAKYRWRLETTARSGRALTSICKNDHGRSDPYHTVLWIAFSPQREDRRDEAQLFVRLDANGLHYGVQITKLDSPSGQRFRNNLTLHSGAIERALHLSGAFDGTFFADRDFTGPRTPQNSPDVNSWVDGKSFALFKSLPSDDKLFASEALVGEILLGFDRLLPVFACALEDDAAPFLAKILGGLAGQHAYADRDFLHATFLEQCWLDEVRALLRLKKQMILQGVPGTGKTHVARALARVLSDGHDDRIRVVQFHPAYSYEEFVEGIKIRTQEIQGRSEVVYPVEDGLLCAFAQQAEAHPELPYVLVIDEINRGNLPRIFGELLYLLEYRGQALRLPYSQREFRLPENLYLIGTMNAADRSVAVVDQALRRRFSFLEMLPDSRVLERYFHQMPPVEDGLDKRVSRLLVRLNHQLRRDFGPTCQIGHSYYMTPSLDSAKLKRIWRHHVRPVLEDFCSGRPDLLAHYEIEQLLRAPQSNRNRRRQTAAANQTKTDS